jgi:S1-C subfamily serine protease
MFLDYSRVRIILEPSPTFADPFDRAHSGIALRAHGADFRAFRVHEVLEDSPAIEAGIQEGDIITAVDGTPAASFTLTALAETLEKPGTYTLTIQRGEQVLTVKLTSRRMI